MDDQEIVENEELREHEVFSDQESSESEDDEDQESWRRKWKKITSLKIEVKWSENFQQNFKVKWSEVIFEKRGNFTLKLEKSEVEVKRFRTLIQDVEYGNEE